MSSDVLDRALDELVERCDDAYGDWDDVLERAHVTVKHPRLLVAAVAVLVATPAFGVRHLLLDVIRGRTDVPFEKTKPAPAVVRRQFADLGVGAPPSLAPQAIVGESRTAGVFRAGG